MEKAFRAHVRRKAIQAGNTIIYEENGQLVEEDPATSKKVILISELKTS